MFASIQRTPIATCITDPRKPDNPIVAVNDAFSELTGYAASQAIGRNCRFLGGAETEEEPRAALCEAIASGRRVLVELTNYRRDGSKFRNAVMIAPLFGADDRVAFYVGSQMDVSAGSGATRRQASGEQVDGLTPRQRDVLKLMTAGLRNKQIAGELGIDETTVKMHRARLLERLGAMTTADAIRIGVEAGL